MAGITDLISKIGDDNIEFQILDSSITNIKSVKGGSKIEFITSQITPSDVAMNTGKRCLIVWVDGDVFSQALRDIGIK